MAEKGFVEGYNLGEQVGYRNALNKLINMKRPTKEDMKIMLKEFDKVDYVHIEKEHKELMMEILF